MIKSFILKDQHCGNPLNKTRLYKSRRGKKKKFRDFFSNKICINYDF